jgi:hypothetical protein
MTKARLTLVSLWVLLSVSPVFVLAVFRDGAHEENGDPSGVYLSTDDYLSRFEPLEYMRAGTDFYNPRYSLDRLNKPLDEIDITYDYPFHLIEEATKKLRFVDRRLALKGIFEKITSGAADNHDRHLLVRNFLQNAAYHNHVQPMYPDGQAVFDPLILLELGEMRCGAVARVAADLFDAAGYKTRLVQANAHVTAEVFYDGKWSLMEADLFGGPPLVIDGRIPSVAELAQNPFLIDKLPTGLKLSITPLGVTNKSKSRLYPSYFFFSRAALEKIDAAYYYKTATPEQAVSSKWYGWNYWDTTADRWTLSEFDDKYEPGAPEFKDIRRDGAKYWIEWFPAHDSDNDTLGYRVYVSRKSRGWNYQMVHSTPNVRSYVVEGWNPEMYDHVFKEPPKEIGYFETSATSVELTIPSGGNFIFVTVMAFDRHGESVGRRLYNMSAELRLPN